MSRLRWMGRGGVVVVALLLFYIHDISHQVATDGGYLAPWPAFLTAKAMLSAGDRAILSSLPPSALILKHATAYVHSAVLTASVELGLPDALSSSPSSCASPRALAEGIGLSSHQIVPLRNMLVLLSQMGVLDRRGRELPSSARQGGGGGEEYCLNAASSLLVTSHVYSMADAVLTLGGEEHTRVMHALGRTMEREAESGEEGEGGFEDVYGAKMWDYFARVPGVGEQFDRAMTAIERGEMNALLADGDWGAYDIVVDVGGGAGRLLARLLAENEGMTGVLVDRGPVIDGSRAAWSSERHLVHFLKQGRIHFVLGDVFSGSRLSLPPFVASAVSQDAARVAVVLKHVLHDWNDSACRTILATLASAVPAGTDLILIQRVLGDPGSSVVYDQGGYVSSALMYAMFGGRERRVGEMEELLREQGFDLVEVRGTRAAVDVIVARRRHQRDQTSAARLGEPVVK